MEALETLTLPRRLFRVREGDAENDCTDPAALTRDGSLAVATRPHDTPEKP